MQKRKIKILIISSIITFLAAGCSPQAADKQTRDISQPADEIQRQQIQVSQKVDGQFSDKLFNFYADENKTAMDLLGESYKVETKSSSGSAESIIGIGGIEADSKHFWQFFVNGQAENPDNYEPQNGDKIEWKLSPKAKP